MKTNKTTPTSLLPLMTGKPNFYVIEAPTRHVPTLKVIYTIAEGLWNANERIPEKVEEIVLLRDKGVDLGFDINIGMDSTSGDERTTVVLHFQLSELSNCDLFRMRISFSEDPRDHGSNPEINIGIEEDPRFPSEYMLLSFAMWELYRTPNKHVETKPLMKRKSGAHLA